MESKKVFFSCVCDGCYKEFVIDNYEEFVDVLNKDEHFLLKYASAFSKEERDMSFSKLSIVQGIKKSIGFRQCDNRENYISLNNLINENEDINKYTFHLLSNARLVESFSLPLKDINKYFLALNRAVIANPDLDMGARECMFLYNEGIKNTDCAKENNVVISIVDGSLLFEKKVDLKTNNQDKKKEYIKLESKRKIS